MATLHRTIATRSAAGSRMPFDVALTQSGIISDPYAFGALRFQEEALVIDAAFERELHRVAEAVAEVYDELARIVTKEPALLDDFFALTPCQKWMWLASCPLWHVHARADVFETEHGLRITELNSDTPTGHAEAVVLGELAARENKGFRDPNAGLLDAMIDAFDAITRDAIAPSLARTVGIVYPTDLPEDAPLLRLYASRLAVRGYRIVTGSPRNVVLDSKKRATMFGVPFGLCLRHYKTDWWGERVPVFTDEEPYDDALPLAEPLHALVTAEDAGQLRVVNPFGAVLTQNKRTLAFMWEEKHRFTADAQRTIEAHVPHTVRLESLHAEQVIHERARWVLKSDYGAEGDEVFIGADLTDDAWKACIMHASQDRFVVQEKFEPLERPDRDCILRSRNFGVYVVAGRAAGIYARTQREHVDVPSASAPVLVRP